MFAVIKMELSGKSVCGPVLKTTQLSAHAQNHASPECCHKSGQWSYMAGHVVNPSTKFEDPTAIRS